MDALSAQMGYEKRWCWVCGKQASSSHWRHRKPILRLKPPQKKDKVSLDPSQASWCFLGQCRILGEAIVGRKRWEEKFRRVCVMAVVARLCPMHTKEIEGCFHSFKESSCKYKVCIVYNCGHLGHLEVNATIYYNRRSTQGSYALLNLVTHSFRCLLCLPSYDLCQS